MSGERIERDQLVIRDNTGVVFSNYPIHFAGAALHMRNASNNDSVVEVHESDDGATWSVVTFSTVAAAGLLNATLSGLSYLAILFTSSSKYIRLRLKAENTDGVYASMTQYPPKARETSDEYA